MSRRRAFSLIEAVVVLVLLAIVATIAVRALSASSGPTGQAVARGAVERVIAGQLAWAQVEGDYSPDGSGLTDTKGLTLLPAGAASTATSEVSLGVTTEGTLAVAVQGPAGCLAVSVSALEAGAERLEVAIDDDTACAAASAVPAGESLVVQ